MGVSAMAIELVGHKNFIQRLRQGDGHVGHVKDCTSSTRESPFVYIHILIGSIKDNIRPSFLTTFTLNI